MIDFTTIDPEVLDARGKYATVRAAHEDAKKHMQKLCDIMISGISQLNRAAQAGKASDFDMDVYRVTVQHDLETIIHHYFLLLELDAQRNELRQLAWKGKAEA